jgi:chaperone modulatory protein CbpM
MTMDRLGGYGAETAVVEEHVVFSLSTLIRASGADEAQVCSWVAEGLLHPQGLGPEKWRFSGAALRQARTAQRLARDFEIGPAAMALVLDLLADVDTLRRQLRNR